MTIMNEFPTFLPYQQRMIDMMLAIPDGTRLRMMAGGRLRGTYASKDGKLTHRWNGETWEPLSKEIRLP
jgi:hypothetical protein